MKNLFLYSITSLLFISCGSPKIPEEAVGIYKSEIMSGVFLNKSYNTTNWVTINPKANNPIGLFQYGNLEGKYKTYSEGWESIESLEEIESGVFEIKCDRGNLQRITLVVDVNNKIIYTEKGGVNGEYTLEWKSKSPCFSEKNCDCNPNCMGY